MVVQQAALSTTQLLVGISAVIAAITGATPKVFLYTNAIAPGPDNVYSDFTVPTASWYTPKTAVLTPTYRNLTDDTYNFALQPTTWTYSGTDGPTVIHGVGIFDGTSVFFGGFQLPAPVTLASTLDTFIAPPGEFKFSSVPPGNL